MTGWDLLNSYILSNDKSVYTHIEESSDHKKREWILFKYKITGLEYFKEKLP